MLLTGPPPCPTVSYKQEDCYDLPCLATLTSSNTEIRYKIKLKSNQKEKKNTALITTLLLVYYCMQVKREQIKPSIPTHTERGRRWGKKRKKAKCCHKHAGMEKQVSANDDLNPTRCCCVPSVKCMHQFEFDRWEKKRKESPKKKKSLFKTIYGIKGFHNRMWRFISTAKYYRNDSSCFPEQIIFKFSEAPCKVSMQTVDEQRREDIHRGRLLTCFKVRGLYYLFVLTR